MAIDQSLISNDLRPLNFNRTAGEDPQLRPVYYHVVAPDSAPGGLGLGYAATPNSVAAWTPPPLVTGRPSETASDEGSDDPSPRKVKFLCSYGGRILHRPGDGALRYVGGQTRIVSVRREIRFPELMEKMVEIYGESVAIKYQLPEEDLDALVSVSCSEDLANLMEEYERAVETPSSEGSGKIRVFLFSALELDPSGVMQIGDLSDGGQRYVDAVNGIPSPDSTGPIRRKESVASASSTQYSDGLMSVGEVGDTSSQGEPGDGATLAALSPTMSPTGVVSHGGGRLVYMPSNSMDSAPLNLPPIITGHPQSFPSSAGSDPESERQFSGTGQSSSAFSSHVNLVDYRQVPTYVQAYSEIHPETFHNRIDYLQQNSSQAGYKNPESFGPGRSVYWCPDHSPQQLQSHQFVPMIHSSMSPSSPPMSAPNAGQHQYVQLHQMRVDPYMEESSCGARSIQIPADQRYNTFQFQQRPQSPGRLLPGQTVEQPYNWRQVQAVPSPDHVIRTDIWVPQSHQRGILSLQSEKTSRQEDCFMCQKELPHAHSDTILQDHGIPGIAKTISDTDAVLQGHHPDESMRSKLPQRVAVAGGEFPIEHQNEQQRASGVDVNTLGFQGAGVRPKFVGHIDPTVRDVTASQLVSYGFPQVPESQHGNERIIMPKAENPDYQRTLLPLGLVGFPGDGQASYGMLLGNLPQSPQEAVLQQPAIPSQYQVKQDMLMNKTVGADVPPGRTVAFQTSEPSVPGQNLVFVQKEDTSDVSHDYLRPIDGRIEALHISPTEISGITEQYRSQIKPMDSPTNDVKAENVLLGVDSGIRATEPFILSNVNIGREDILDNVTQIAGKDSYMINAFIKPGVTLDGNYGEWKDEASRIQNRGIFNDAAAPTKDSLFSNQDPWNLRRDLQFLVPTNSNGESCSGSSGELRMAAQIKEVSFHQPLEDLNKDTRAETIQLVKEEQIRHELQSVAEGVAASVLLPPIPLVSVLSGRERDESFPPESNQDGEVLQNYEETETTLVQDLKNKLLDKTNPSLAPIAEGINRLQIIKNSDLEELRELGSGTFGTVYHGKWRGTDVAIKRINDRCFAGKPSEQERLRDDFWNEACNLADLHHPNVVAFYGVVLDGPGGSVATVTEYMVNGSLRHALQRNDRILDYRKRLFITMDVAFGMEYLHGKNIVHFDLKSDNLLVNLRDPQRPICKVGDLGLSKVKCQTLISGGVRGTLPWMAPELLNGSSSMVSDKVDVFSFGIVMWELLTGDEPYADLHYGAIIGGIVSNTLRPAVPKTCDPQWRSLMERCWSSEPLERPSFAEIADTLRSMAASLPPKGHAQHHHAP